MKKGRKTAPLGAGETAVAAQRIQSEQEASDAERRAKKASKKTSKQTGAAQQAALQAGARKQPVELPPEALKKPGNEADMRAAPQFMAPDYRGSGKLDGFAAIVTGGDSGIGRAVAVLFAREGADVVVAYLDEHEDAEETKRCIEGEGRRCLLLAGDVKDPTFCRRVAARALKEFGRLDVLVNNAGFQEHAASIEEITDERLDLTFRTNIYGYFHMAKAVLPHMKQGAAIVNTGSVTGLQGSGGLLDYSATKGAIHAFTKALAQNVMDKGIRVNAVAPGPVWTPLNPSDGPDGKRQGFGTHTDMKRAAQPEELSPAYVFLAAPACSGYITGIVLPVTGSVGAI